MNKTPEPKPKHKKKKRRKRGYLAEAHPTQHLPYQTPAEKGFL
jgi:hypothetical protein